MSIDGMSKNDRDVLTAFEDRFATFKSLKPALADADFKKYFADFISELGTLAAELKTKKKSLSRRSNKETDILYLHGRSGGRSERLYPFCEMLLVLCVMIQVGMFQKRCRVILDVNCN